jgi:hypothetical protein
LVSHSQQTMRLHLRDGLTEVSKVSVGWKERTNI